MIMKFRYILLTILTALCGATGLARTTASTFGVRADMELTFPSGGHDYYQTGAGLVIGPVARIPLSSKFSIEPGVMFNYTALSAQNLVSFNDDYYYDSAANLYGIRVPLLVSYTRAISENADFSVATGPQFNINISARQRLQPNFDAPVPEPRRTIDLFNHGWKRFDAQWNLRLSVTFAKQYYLGITTGVAFTPLAKFGDKDKKIRIYRNTIALSLGYNF